MVEKIDLSSRPDPILIRGVTHFVFEDGRTHASIFYYFWSATLEWEDLRAPIAINHEAPLSPPEESEP